MNLFFIPGRTPSVSLLELASACRTNHTPLAFDRVSRDVFLGSTQSNVDVEPLFHSLGGMIKYGGVHAVFDSQNAALSFISRSLCKEAETTTKRITFGLSTYTISQRGRKENRRSLAYEVQRAGVGIKKELVRIGASARFVAAQHNELALSSVVVTKNNLLDEGNAEWVIIHEGDRWHVGKTRGVQKFEEFSQRDWDRPNRDMLVGLLPPKIARIMIHLSETPPSATILDPFCGLGTILQEALHLGYTHVYGSDLEQKQIDSTKENLAWLSEEKNLSLQNVLLLSCQAQNVSRCFPHVVFDAIVTEPYLGPIMNHRSTHVDTKIQNDLCSLYIDSLREWKKMLKKNGRVVVVFPFWVFQKGNVFLPCLKEIKNLGFKNVTIPSELSLHIPDKTDRNSLLIVREGQRVGRELFVFEN